MIESVEECFLALKNRVEDIRFQYYEKSREKNIDLWLTSKLTDDEEYESLEEEIKPIKATSIRRQPTNDGFTDLIEEANNLQKDFLNKDTIKLINEKDYQLFGRLLSRTFRKIEFYFLDRDLYSEEVFYNFLHIKKVFTKLKQQFRRLFDGNTLTDYDNYLLKYESILQQRHYAQTNFSSLKNKHANQFDIYIQQCIKFHSTLCIDGICEKIDQLITNLYGEQILLNEKQRKILQSAFKRIDIPLVNPQIISRQTFHPKEFPADVVHPSQIIDNSTMDYSMEYNTTDLLKAIRNHRWVILLGNAGSGKTTFVRWLTCEMARILLNDQNNVFDVDMGPRRIPIFIRIGEFAQWLVDHNTSNLFDYIGKHTWLNQTYINDSMEMLKDFVRNGHVLIIFDGLDEVSTFELYNRVINHVQTFIENFCLSADFVSPFDDGYVANTQFPLDFCRESFAGKNLVLITSRIANYTIKPLYGNLIPQYTIRSMSIEYLQNFIYNWCSSVQNVILELLIKYLPDINKNIVKNRVIIKAKTLIEKLKSRTELQPLISNPSILSIICMLYIQYGSDILAKTRIQLYEHVADMIIERWERRLLNIPRNALISIASNMAFYIHFHSSSGLIDEFDLIQLCRLSLQQWYQTDTHSINMNFFQIRQEIDKFIELLNEDAGIVCARSLCFYGFTHLTFQEYFVSHALLNFNQAFFLHNKQEIITKSLSLLSKSRLREPLNLILGSISLYWNFENYNDFCNEIQSKTIQINKYIPVGSLWFCHALLDLTCLPSVTVIENILDSLLDVDVNEKICIFKNELITILDQLPISIIELWFERLFSKEKHLIFLKMLQIIYEIIYKNRLLPQWITKNFCQMLWKQFHLFNEDTDIYIDRILTMVAVINDSYLPTPSNSLRAYLLSEQISTEEIHSSIFSAVITLYGGLERKKIKRETSIVFKAHRIHRDSPLSTIFIEYFQNKSMDRSIKLQRLINQCQQRVNSKILTPEVIHSSVILFCFYGIDQSIDYKQSISTELWQKTLSYMRMVLLYLREFFAFDSRKADDINLLQQNLHPFQCLQHQPTALLLAYLPTSLQNLYVQLFKAKQISIEYTCNLSYLHLLLKFLLYILEMDNYSIRFSVLLTILLPTIQSYKMENFILMFMDNGYLNSSYSRYKKHFSNAYYNNISHPFLNIIKNVDLIEQIQLTSQTLTDEEYRMQNAQNDLQLYASCCCVAQLLKKKFSLYGDKKILEIKYDQLWKSINRIQEPLWKLDVAIYIFSILIPFSSKHYYSQCILSWLKDLELTIPLLTYVVLFINCIHIIHQSPLVEKRLLLNIFKRLKTVTLIEQQAICQALISITYFDYDIKQYICQSQLLENIITLKEIFNENITTFAKYFLTKFFSINEMKQTNSTLLISMYLSGLIEYLEFLNDSNNKQIDLTDSKISASEILFKQCIEILEKDPEKILTNQAVSAISTFLSLRVLQIQTKQINQINQYLMKKSDIDKSVRSTVFKWIKYRDNQVLQLFSYSIALLLASSNIWTTFIIKICCECSISKNDDLRSRAESIFLNRKWKLKKQHTKMIINYFQQWDKNENKWLAEIDHFLNTLDVQTIKEIKQIIKLEHERFNKILQYQSITLEKMNNYSCGISYFRLIKIISLKVEKYIITYLHSLLSYSKEVLLFQWFIQQIFDKFSNKCETFLNFLIDLLLNSHDFSIKMTVIKCLIHFRHHKKVQRLLWTIAMNTEQNYSNDLIAASIYSLCTTDEVKDFAEENFENLNTLRQHSNSSVITQVIAAKMHPYIAQEPEKYTVVEVYYAFLSNMISSSGYDKYRHAIKTSHWILKYRSILLTQFFDDIYQTIDKCTYFDISACVKVLEDICQNEPDEFRIAIRRSRLGEKNLLKCLFEICKNSCASEQRACLEVYACFENASIDYIQMYLTIMLYESYYLFNDLNYITNIRFVSERQSLDILFDSLQNSLSLKQRYYAANLLIHLALLDQVSAIDVQNLIVKVIDDPISQGFLDATYPSSTLDQKLKLLLIRLLIKEIDSIISPIKMIDRINQKTDGRILAALIDITDS